MVVAGDHANNDMADEEDPESWVSMFKADGSFEEVLPLVKGLGRIPAVEDLYVAHTGAVLQ
jgi:cobalamin biosynthesis Co2+ chelatase CbiK